MALSSTSDDRPRVLIFVTHYLPGYRFGGPIRSISRVVEALGAEYDLRVVTADRDFGVKEPYRGIQPGNWCRVGAGHVLYVRSGARGLLDALRVLRAKRYDLIYLNSFFERAFSMLPFAAWRVGLAGQVPLLIAPRGEFSRGALALKPNRKRCFLAAVRFLRVYQGVSWHASTDMEAEDVGRAIGPGALIHVAAPLPGRAAGSATPDPGRSGSQLDSASLADYDDGASQETATKRSKRRGVARIVFVGRVVPMKNLGFALAILAEVKGEVEFNIFGPLEDRVYWERCRGMLADLPPSVSVRYGGELHPDAVPAILAEHHLLFLPTLGENFGHVISESLAAGCPVLISDRTPWRHLEQAGGGWDLPLEDAEAFRQALQSCIDLDEDHHQQLRAAARALVMPSGPAGLGPDAYRRMLNGVLRGDVPRLEAGR